MMSVAANHASTSAHDGLVLNLALRALRASHGVSSGSKDAAEQARACSDVTECSDPQLSESLSLRSSSHLQLENDLRRAPTRTQPPSSSSSQNQQMQQQLQMLLQQRLLQQQLNEPAAAENLLHPPPPPPPQQQKQQFGPASPAAAPNAALLSSLLQRLASTYASASATAVTNADFRSAAQAAPPQGAAAASGADSNAAVAAIVSKSPASPLADANAAALLHLARLVAGSAAGGSRGAGLAAQVNAVERNMANFFPSSAAPVAPPFSSVAPPSLTSIYPPPSVSGSPATSAAARSPHDSPRAATLRDLNIAAAAVAAAASGSPQVRAGAGNGVFGGAICGASFPNGGLHGGEKERDRAPLKRRFWETNGGEDGKGSGAAFPAAGGAGGTFGASLDSPEALKLGIRSPEGAGDFRLSGSSEDGDGKESGGPFLEGPGEWDNNEGEGEEGEGDGDAEMNGNKKKMRLTRAQLTMLEEFFKKHPHLTPRQKAGLAKSLGVRVRQVEVWFQNRRARTKVKQTEAELEGLRRRCQQLADENKRLKLQLARQERGERGEREEREGKRRAMEVGISRSTGIGEVSAKGIKANSEPRKPKCSSCLANMGLEEREMAAKEAPMTLIQFL